MPTMWSSSRSYQPETALGELHRRSYSDAIDCNPGTVRCQGEFWLRRGVATVTAGRRGPADGKQWWCLARAGPEGRCRPVFRRRSVVAVRARWPASGNWSGPRASPGGRDPRGRAYRGPPGDGKPPGDDAKGVGGGHGPFGGVGLLYAGACRSGATVRLRPGTGRGFP
jgi:hypothetical protein